MRTASLGVALLLWAGGALVPATSLGPATFFCGTRLSAAEPTPQQRDLFENHIRPTLVSDCIQCHGETKQEGGLRLTSLEGLLAGGDSGPAIVPGEPDASLLVEALRFESFEMPPSGPLESEAIDGVAAWIAAGAPWPQGVTLKPTPKITAHDRDWWCYQPIAAPAVPSVDDHGWCRNEIDHFIFRRLHQEGLSPASEADRRTLTRRVHFAVTGLPPTDQAAAPAEETAAQDAWYEALVDRLLEQPAYGENQARYWLDLVRYADSDGYNADHPRPQAHHYRDYVIRSFNEDKPYDRFVQEQLAGDEIDPGNRDALIATMYLRHYIYEYNQRDVEGQWAQIINDVTETTADVFLAQGVKCARCHDHKFDPLLQRDYYALRAFFTPLLPREDQPIADVETRAAHLEQLHRWEAATEDIRRRLHEIEMPVLLEKAGGQGFDKFTTEIQTLVASRRHEISPYEFQIAELTRNQLVMNPEKLPEWLDEEQAAERQRLRAELAKLEHLKPEPLPTISFVASDVGPVAPPTFIPDAADPSPIQPAFPVILDGEPATIQPPHEALQSTGRRTALARWITSPENPLTARVIVNRVWQQHFGRGLVPTPSDFGRLGTPPSHPELLDWLARRFMADGWSLKRLHRLILTSATYRQSSLRPADPQLAELDPQNVLLWRMNPRRLSGEEIHDSALTASGELSKGKRAIYKTVKRNALDPLLAAFDFPDRVESQGSRHRTTTSPQALLQMNNPWWHERAQAMVKRGRGDSTEALVQTAYQQLYFRAPTADEQQRAVSFVRSYAELIPDAEAPQRLAALPDGRPAIALDAKQSASIQVPAIAELSNRPAAADQEGHGDFTIEATVMLHSLYPDASVRTIAAGWSGNNAQPGWSLGVTSTKSSYKPRNLILQLVGSRDSVDGKPQYEVIASNLRVELNKPYHIAVAIDLDDASTEGITFYLRDLSKPGAPPQVAHVAHQARWNVHAKRPIEIGGRSNHHRWDGLIQNVRLHAAALSREELFAPASTAEPASTAAPPEGPAPPQNDKAPPQNDKAPPPDDEADSRLLLDLHFASETQLGHDRSPSARHATVRFEDAALTSPREIARTALLHAFLCSNEMIYVD